MELDIVHLLSQFGFPVAVALTLMWYFAKREARSSMETIAREERLAGRVDELEGFIRDDLHNMTKEVTAALVNHTTTNRELALAVRESNDRVAVLMTKMLERPCLVPEPEPEKDRPK